MCQNLGNWAQNRGIVALAMMVQSCDLGLGSSNSDWSRVGPETWGTAQDSDSTVSAITGQRCGLGPGDMTQVSSNVTENEGSES